MSVRSCAHHWLVQVGRGTFTEGHLFALDGTYEGQLCSGTEQLFRMLEPHHHPEGTQDAAGTTRIAGVTAATSVMAVWNVGPSFSMFSSSRSFPLTIPCTGRKWPMTIQSGPGDTLQWCSSTSLIHYAPGSRELWTLDMVRHVCAVLFLHMPVPIVFVALVK